MIENVTFFVENVSAADLPFCYHYVCIDMIEAAVYHRLWWGGNRGTLLLVWAHTFYIHIY